MGKRYQRLLGTLTLSLIACDGLMTQTESVRILGFSSAGLWKTAKSWLGREVELGSGVKAIEFVYSSDTAVE